MEIVYLSLHCQHQNDFCIKTGSDESHFNVSLIVKDKVTRQFPQTTTFEEKGERNRTEASLLTPHYKTNTLIAELYCLLLIDLLRHKLVQLQQLLLSSLSLGSVRTIHSHPKKHQGLGCVTTH